ncbi:lysozyme isoform X1 [Helicoverpa armigera]|uniref:lysozyme isoform X1 n=1 Tax=Helicoverpa armigera TaxID=29058 RepID=UPI002111B53A|nr:lysozyme isoform X1 [Helicoverpa armigera]
MARPTHLILLFVMLGVVHTSQGHARSFTRCQLSRELLRYNFPRSMIPNWVCLIEHASGRTTDKVTNHNNSYISYGLFQVSVAANLPEIVAFWPLATAPGTEKINNKDWCKKGRKGGHCNIKCEDLLNEDLADDVRCAKRIYDRVGFKAWPTSFSYCKENSLPDLSRC